jgi:hypothetical protein
VVICLQLELEEAKAKLRQLEDVNTSLGQSVVAYRGKWMNECREMDAWRAMHMRGEDLNDAPCLSQARWYSSSPIRPYG